MILCRSFRDDLIDLIRDEPEKTFEAAGKSRIDLYADRELLDAMWANYQKAVSEYDIPPLEAYAQVMLDCAGIRVAPEPDDSEEKLESKSR